MTESFVYSFNAIAPVIPLIVLGYLLKLKGYLDDHTLKRMNLFSFRFTMPALMFCNIYTLPSLSAIRLDTAILVLFSAVVITLIGFAISMFSTKQHNRRGVIIQASFRSNFAVIGTILSINLCGAEGLAVTTGILAPGILYYNIMAVICLAAFSDRTGKTKAFAGVLKEIVANPLIIGISCGMFCLLARSFIPLTPCGIPVFSISKNFGFLYSPIKSLADMTMPLVLVLLGAQLDFGAVAGFKKELVASVSMRLVGAPAIGFATAFLMQSFGRISLTPAVVSAMLGFWGAPMAVAGAVMAEEMGSDGDLARQCAVWSSVLSIFTLFLWILLLRVTDLL